LISQLKMNGKLQLKRGKNLFAINFLKSFL